MERKPRIVIFEEEVRKKILAGLETIYRAVSTTLSSRGRNVALENNWGPPIVVHDGVTIARQIILEDPYENMAAGLVIQAAQKTNDEAGDGTTATTILSYAIAKEAIQQVAHGINPMVIRKGINIAVEKIIASLKELATPVTSFEEMVQVATISAADRDMGTLIATAIEKVGKEGVVTVQEGRTSGVEVEYKEGMELDSGWVSPYLITNPERFEAEYEQTKGGPLYVVVLDERMTNATFGKLAGLTNPNDKKPKVLFIATDFDIEALQSIVFNKYQGGYSFVAVKAPEFGEHRTNLLSDIATVTGGTLIGGDVGVPLESVTLEHIGQCDRVNVSKSQTVIIGGHGKKEDIDARVVAIKNAMQDARDEFQKDKLEARIAKLIGGVAVILVGASSEAERREIKERVYDAVNATKAAISEGVVPGGGVALIRAGKSLDTLTDINPLREGIGVEIVRSAILYPLRKIAQNSGHDLPDHVVGIVKDNPDPQFGYNVETESFERLIDVGIIDPVKVVRTALENAASVAIMLITTDAMVAFKPMEKSTDNELEGIGQLP